MQIYGNSRTMKNFHNRSREILKKFFLNMRKILAAFGGIGTATF